MASVKTWTALWQALGCTRTTLLKYRRMTNAPRDKDPEKWAAFIYGIRSGGVKNADGTGDESGMATAEVAKRKRVADMLLREAEARMKEREDRHRAGELLERSEVEANVARAYTTVQQTLMSMGPGIAVEAQAMLVDAQGVDSLASFITDKVREALVQLVEKLEAL